MSEHYYIATLFWLHLIGICIWVGASLLMPLVILPTVQQLDPPARPKFMEALSKRMTPLIFASIGVVIVTGILQTGAIFQTFQVFMGINVLSVKTFVALLMVANGTYLSVVLPRRAASLAPAPGAPPSPQFLRTMRLLGMHSWIQAGLSVIILFIVGLLTAP